MNPIYSEEVEVVRKSDGSYFCQLRWGKKIWEEKLPRGIERWPKPEYKSHMKDVVSRLRVKMLHLQKELLDTGKIDPTEVTPSVEMSAGDLDRFQRAVEKRKKRAKKRLKLVH